MPQMLSFIDAANEIMRLYNRGELPARVLSAIQAKLDAKGGTVEVIIEFVETVYAYRADGDMTPEIMELAAEVSDIASVHNFYGLQIDNRGPFISAILRGADLPTGVEEPQVYLPAQEAMTTTAEDPALPGDVQPEQPSDAAEGDSDASTTE